MVVVSQEGFYYLAGGLQGKQANWSEHQNGKNSFGKDSQRM